MATPNLNLARAINTKLFDQCVEKTKEVCRAEYGKEISDDQALNGCVEQLAITFHNQIDKNSTQEGQAYAQILGGLTRFATPEGVVKPVFWAAYNQNIQDLGHNLGVFTAQRLCDDESEANALVHSAEVARVNRAPGGGLPEAAAYSVTGAVGVFNRKDEFTIGGIVVLGLALVLLNWRSLSFRFVTSRASHFFSRFVY